MKKLCTALLLFSISLGVSFAQSSETSSARSPSSRASGNSGNTNYTTAVGMRVNVAGSLPGVGIKQFFAPNHAAEAALIFPDDGGVILEALYGYHGKFGEADGLYWYAGAGFLNYFTEGEESEDYFGLPLLVGFEYKIPRAPLVLGFDWQPLFWLSDGLDDRFDASFVGVTVRAAF